MNTKQIVIAMLVVGGLAMWLLGGDDEPIPPAASPPQQPSRQYAPVVPAQPPGQTRSRPRTPEPRFDYDTARRPWQQEPFPNPNLQPAPPGYWGETQYQTDTRSDTRGYQFRPLTEGDRRRMGTPDSVPYRSAPPQPPAPYGTWADGRHRFRSPALEGKAERYEPPYQVPAWGAEPDYAEQWDLAPWQDPALGPQPYRDPPARRMLPSLDWSSDRTFTAR